MTSKNACENAGESVAFRTAYQAVLYRAAVGMILPAAVFEAGFIESTLVLLVTASFLTALLVLISWIEIKVTQKGIFLKRGLGAVTGKKVFIDDERVDSVREIKTLRIRIFKLLLIAP